HTAQSIGRVVVGDDKVMQERLGHADIGITLGTYTTWSLSSTGRQANASTRSSRPHRRRDEGGRAVHRAHARLSAVPEPVDDLDEFIAERTRTNPDFLRL